MSTEVRHFLDLSELDAGTLRRILDQASALKVLLSNRAFDGGSLVASLDSC